MRTQTTHVSDTGHTPFVMYALFILKCYLFFILKITNMHYESVPPPQTS